MNPIVKMVRVLRSRFRLGHHRVEYDLGDTDSPVRSLRAEVPVLMYDSNANR